MSQLSLFVEPSRFVSILACVGWWLWSAFMPTYGSTNIFGAYRRMESSFCLFWGGMGYSADQAFIMAIVSILLLGLWMGSVVAALLYFGRRQVVKLAKAVYGVLLGYVMVMHAIFVYLTVVSVVRSTGLGDSLLVWGYSQTFGTFLCSLLTFVYLTLFDFASGLLRRWLGLRWQQSMVVVGDWATASGLPKLMASANLSELENYLKKKHGEWLKYGRFESVGRNLQVRAISAELRKKTPVPIRFFSHSGEEKHFIGCGVHVRSDLLRNKESHLVLPLHVAVEIKRARADGFAIVAVGKNPGGIKLPDSCIKPIACEHGFYNNCSECRRVDLHVEAFPEAIFNGLGVSWMDICRARITEASNLALLVPSSIQGLEPIYEAPLDQYGEGANSTYSAEYISEPGFSGCPVVNRNAIGQVMLVGVHTDGFGPGGHRNSGVQVQLLFNGKSRTSLIAQARDYNPESPSDYFNSVKFDFHPDREDSALYFEDEDVYRVGKRPRSIQKLSRRDGSYVSDYDVDDVILQRLGETPEDQARAAKLLHGVLESASGPSPDKEKVATKAEHRKPANKPKPKKKAKNPKENASQGNPVGPGSR